MTKASRGSRKTTAYLSTAVIIAVVLSAPILIEIYFQGQRLDCFRHLQEAKAPFSEFGTHLGEPAESFLDGSNHCHAFDVQLYSRGFVCEKSQGGEELAYIQWRDPVMGPSLSSE